MGSSVAQTLALFELLVRRGRTYVDYMGDGEDGLGRWLTDTGATTDSAPGGEGVACLDEQTAATVVVAHTRARAPITIFLLAFSTFVFFCSTFGTHNFANATGRGWSSFLFGCVDQVPIRYFQIQDSPGPIFNYQ
jgi:hypothetical protein